MSMKKEEEKEEVEEKICYTSHKIRWPSIFFEKLMQNNSR